MKNLLLTNENLKEFVESLKISKEQKDVLILRIPLLDEKERFEFLDALKEIYFLDMDEQDAVEKVKNSWEN